LKAPQRITHFSRLRDCGDTVDYFFDVVSGLGQRLGPVLFQLPPNLKKDTSLLERFTECLPPSMRAVCEFRDQSWFDDEVFALLRKRNVCLCIADAEKLATPFEPTANWGYLRLRREDYQKDDIDRWSYAITRESEKWTDAFVYFKHEESGTGPKLALQMIELLAKREPSA
jgi:uncharacterized protein YecE (DUF72 family)